MTAGRKKPKGTAIISAFLFLGSAVALSRFGEILYFGDAPGYPGYFQVNFRVPDGVSPGATVPVRLTYLGRRVTQ